MFGHPLGPVGPHPFKDDPVVVEAKLTHRLAFLINAVAAEMGKGKEPGIGLRAQGRKHLDRVALQPRLVVDPDRPVCIGEIEMRAQFRAARSAGGVKPVKGIVNDLHPRQGDAGPVGEQDPAAGLVTAEDVGVDRIGLAVMGGIKDEGHGREYRGGAAIEKRDFRRGAAVNALIMQHFRGYQAACTRTSRRGRLAFPAPR